MGLFSLLFLSSLCILNTIWIPNAWILILAYYKHILHRGLHFVRINSPNKFLGALGVAIWGTCRTLIEWILGGCSCRAGNWRELSNTFLIARISPWTLCVWNAGCTVTDLVTARRKLKTNCGWGCRKSSWDACAAAATKPGNGDARLNKSKTVGQCVWTQHAFGLVSRFWVCLEVCLSTATKDFIALCVWLKRITLNATLLFCLEWLTIEIENNPRSSFDQRGMHTPWFAFSPCFVLSRFNFCRSSVQQLKIKGFCGQHNFCL